MDSVKHLQFRMDVYLAKLAMNEEKWLQNMKCDSRTGGIPTSVVSTATQTTQEGGSASSQAEQ